MGNRLRRRHFTCAATAPISPVRLASPSASRMLRRKAICMVAAVSLVTSAGAVAAFGSSTSAAATTARGAVPPVREHAASGVRALPRVDGLHAPVAIASDGTHVWVANDLGDSVTELLASTGALVKVISGPSYKFRTPVAVASDGTHVWVANDSGDSVTELLASTGALVR